MSKDGLTHKQRVRLKTPEFADDIDGPSLVLTADGILIADWSELEDEGYIYVLTSAITNAFKIGFSHDPERRVKCFGLPGIILLTYIPATLADERKLHSECAEWRVEDSEWYWPCPALIKHLKNRGILVP